MLMHDVDLTESYEKAYRLDTHGPDIKELFENAQIVEMDLKSGEVIDLYPLGDATDVIWRLAVEHILEQGRI